MKAQIHVSLFIALLCGVLLGRNQWGKALGLIIVGFLASNCDILKRKRTLCSQGPYTIIGIKGDLCVPSMTSSTGEETQSRKSLGAQPADSTAQNRSATDSSSGLSGDSLSIFNTIFTPSSLNVSTPPVVATLIDDIDRKGKAHTIYKPPVAMPHASRRSSFYASVYDDQNGVEPRTPDGKQLLMSL